MSDSERFAALDAFIRAGLDGYITETSLLCAQPGISALGERTPAILACASLVGEILRAHDFQVQLLETPGNPVVVGHVPGDSPRTLLFYNHYDVQPPEPLELWTTPPFQPTLRRGALFARGAKDDKGEFIARLAAVDAVRAVNGGRFPCGITFVVEGQEEVGSPHIAPFVRAHLDLLKADAAIWEEGGINAEGQFVDSLGRRGILYVELVAETLKRDAHSGGASVLPNAAWRLLYALATLRDPRGRILIPGFYDRARGPDAMDEQLMEAMPSDEPRLREEFGVSEFVNGLTGPAFKRAVFNPTCNIAGITGGYQGEGMKTVIPARAAAKVDFRLVPDQDPDDILALLRAHLDSQGFTNVVVNRLGAMWPAKASADDPLVKLCARTAQEVYGKPSLIVPMTGGSSPVYAFAGPLGGIPVISPGLGYAGSRTHAPDENIRLDDFVNAARHIGRILDGFARF